MPGQAQQHNTTIHGEDIVIYHSKRKALLMLLVTLAVAALGLQFLDDPAHQAHIEGVVAVLLVIITMALGAVISIHKIFTTQYAIMINQEGISLHTALIDSDLITWREIEGLSTYQVLSQGRLQITLSDPASFIAQQNRLRLAIYWIVKGNLRRSRMLIVGDGLLPFSANGLLEQIEQRFSKELKRHSIVITRSI